jgi:hypothetical protein
MPETLKDIPFNCLVFACLIGYLFAFIGDIYIGLIVNRMYELTESHGSRKYRWQYPVVSIVERILYISALLLSKGEFIAFWVGLKIVVQYKRWTDYHPPNGREMSAADKAEMGRTLFMNSLTGNALSILYAFVSFKLIMWYALGQKDLAITVPSILVLISLMLYFYLRFCAKPTA